MKEQIKKSYLKGYKPKVHNVEKLAKYIESKGKEKKPKAKSHKRF